jgi:hypothetical protein
LAEKQVRTVLLLVLTTVRRVIHAAAVLFAGAPVSYTLRKRFGDFEELYKYLEPLAQQCGVQLPPFPAGGVRMFLNRNDADVVERRRMAFQQLLDAVFEDEASRLAVCGALIVFFTPVRGSLRVVTQ